MTNSHTGSLPTKGKRILAVRKYWSVVKLAQCRQHHHRHYSHIICNKNRLLETSLYPRNTFNTININTMNLITSAHSRGSQWAPISGSSRWWYWFWPLGQSCQKLMTTISNKFSGIVFSQTNHKQAIR